MEITSFCHKTALKSNCLILRWLSADASGADPPPRAEQTRSAFQPQSANERHFFVSSRLVFSLEPEGDKNSVTHREPRRRGQEDPSVYRTTCIQLQIILHYLVVGESSSDKLPDKHML